MDEQVRVLRVIEYVGNRKWIDKQISMRGVKGTKILPEGCMIREAILGDVVEIIDKAQEVRELETFR